MSSEQDHTQLWDYFRKGDEFSFRRIYDLYYESLLNYGLKFSPNTELAEDAVQDLFIKLWTNRKNINATASVKNYLYKSFRRIIIRKVSASPVYVTAATEEELNFEFQMAHDEILMEKEQLLEIRSALQHALDAMTGRQKEMIYLRFYEDLSYDEIADLMDITTKGAYKLVYRALDKLRDNLGGISLLSLFFMLKNVRLGL